ncbi:MAG: DUF6804 family protein [Bacteroidota bacterium]
MKWLLLICALLLFIGAADLPIGYYTLLRITTFIGAGTVIVTEFDKGINFWIVLFTLTGILFNPIIPVYLHNKEGWIVLDILGGILFVTKFFELISKKSAE